MHSCSLEAYIPVAGLQSIRTIEFELKFIHCSFTPVSTKLASSFTTMNTDTLADCVLSLYRFCKGAATGWVKPTVSTPTKMGSKVSTFLFTFQRKKKHLPTLRRSYAETCTYFRCFLSFHHTSHKSRTQYFESIISALGTRKHQMRDNSSKKVKFPPPPPVRKGRK